MRRMKSKPARWILKALPAVTEGLRAVRALLEFSPVDRPTKGLTGMCPDGGAAPGQASRKRCFTGTRIVLGQRRQLEANSTSSPGQLPIPTQGPCTCRLQLDQPAGFQFAAISLQPGESSRVTASPVFAPMTASERAAIRGQPLRRRA